MNTARSHIVLFCLFIKFVKNDLVHEDEKEYLEFLSNSYKMDQELRYAPSSIKPTDKHHSKEKDIKLADRVILPGGYDALPGRTSFGDYWPLMPFSNQYHMGVSYDTSKGRHVGGDILVPVPYWNHFLNIDGHFIERAQEKWLKVGYINNPVNQIGLTKEQIVKLMTSPSLHHNKQVHPRLPVGALPKNFVPTSCKPPMCDPHTGVIAVGVEANYEIEDGLEGELEVPIPLSKDIAYRYPLSGNIHYDRDDTSFNYAQNLSPLDPLSQAFPDVDENRRDN